MDINSLSGRLLGRFVVLDGADGSGKTTQMAMLIAALESAGAPVTRLREPGGTAIGEQIRELLLTPKGEGMDLRCEMLLYMASRAQLVQQKIKPALAAGQVVLADRYVSSTLAYQGGGGGLSARHIASVAEVAVDGVWPDLTILFDLPIELAMARLVPESGGKKARSDRAVHAGQPGLFTDRIESRHADYHRRVRDAYLAQAEQWPDRYRVIDAAPDAGTVHARVLEALDAVFAA